MRWAFSVLSLVLVTGCELNSDDVDRQPSSEAPAPVFSFKGFRSGMSLEEAKSASLVQDCGPEYDGEVSCKITDARIGAAESDPYLTWAFFKDGTLDLLSIEVRRELRDDAFNSLRSAYGEPCEREVKELQNGFGARFDSNVVRWCFRDGSLSLSDRSERNLNFADLVFHPRREPAPDPTFKPEDL